MDGSGVFEDFRRYFSHNLGRDERSQSAHYLYEALALTLRDRLMERWKRTPDARQTSHCRHAYYLSMEYLMGRTLGNALTLGLSNAVGQALRALSVEMETIATAEHIIMVLCPNDAYENGKELHLKQQFFLASASLQDVLAKWVEDHGVDFTELAEQSCFQLNDTHPSIAVAELRALAR